MTLVWPLGIVVAVGLVLLVVLVTGRRLFAGSIVKQHAFWCPFRGRNARVDFEESAWDGQLRDVQRCSLFAPSTAVQCEKECLRLVELPDTKKESVAGARAWRKDAR